MYFKGEGHSKELAFFVFANSKKTFIFSNHRSFSLWSARYPKEIRFERSDVVGRRFETGLAARLRLCDVTASDSKLAGRRETCSWLAILHKVSNIFFFKRLSTSLFSMVSFWNVERVWLKIIWLKSNQILEWLLKEGLKRLVGSPNRRLT